MSCTSFVRRVFLIVGIYRRGEDKKQTVDSVCVVHYSCIAGAIFSVGNFTFRSTANEIGYI